MNNLNGNRKNEFRRKQEEKQRELALKIEDEAGELREGSLKSEEAIPSLDELCAIGERVEQLTTFSAKEAILHETIDFHDKSVQRRLAALSQVWYHWYGCWCYFGPESVPLCISGVSR